MNTGGSVVCQYRMEHKWIHAAYLWLVAIVRIALGVPVDPFWIAIRTIVYGGGLFLDRAFVVCYKSRCVGVVYSTFYWLAIFNYLLLQ